MQYRQSNEQKPKTSRFIPTIRGDQRALFIGKTGSGKSYLARYMLKVARSKGWRIVIIDPKRDWMGRSTKRRKFAEKPPGTIDNPVLVSEFRPEIAVQIIQPAAWSDEVGRFLMAIMATGNTIIYFDELTQLVTANFVPIEFAIPFTQGRSVNVACWAGTQRPVGLPRLVKDQASIIFLFRVTSYKDREVLGPYMSVEDAPEVINKTLPERYFWYYEETMPRPVLVRPLKIKELGNSGNTDHKSRGQD